MDCPDTRWSWKTLVSVGQRLLNTSSGHSAQDEGRGPPQGEAATAGSWGAATGAEAGTQTSAVLWLRQLPEREKLERLWELRTDTVTLMLHLWGPPGSKLRGEGQMAPHGGLKTQLCSQEI